jgi:hypothetical protein
LSRISSDPELLESIKKNGVIDPPILLEVKDRFIAVTGHKRISACRTLGHQAIAAVIWKKFDFQEYFKEAVRKTYRRSAGLIGRIRGFMILCRDEECVNRIDSLRRSLFLPKNFDQSQAKTILSIPKSLLSYLDEKDASFKLIEKLISFDGEIIRLISVWVVNPFRFSIFRSIIEIYDDIRRSNECMKAFEECRYSFEEKSDEFIYGLMYKIRYPLISKYNKETSDIASRYRSRKIELEFPQNGEGNTIKVTITLKKNDQGRSFYEALDFLGTNSIEEILILL